jgi:hypothetical protein
MELLRGVRRQYVAEFLGPVEGGQPWAGERQNMMLPISLYGEGVMLYKSREWGPLPRELRPVSEDEEAEWMGKLSTAMGREVNISLATAVASGRTLSAVRSLEEDGGQMVYKVAGASNAARTVAALTRKGVAAEKFGQRGWSLSVEKDVRELVNALKETDMSKQVLVFHCMDNGSFFSMDRCGGSSLPKKKNNAYHITGKLVVASGYALELMVEQMAHIVKEGKVGTAVVITPMPRYLDPCCIEHGAGKTEEQLEEERGKLLKAVWNLKREVFQLLAKQHCKNITVVSPMEVLGVKDSVAGVRSVMSDGVHLNKDALDKVVDHVIQGVEELSVKKKRGPTERAGPADKKPRVASASSFEGGRGGRGAGGRGGRGKGGFRQFSSYSSY